MFCKTIFKIGLYSFVVPVYASSKIITEVKKTLENIKMPSIIAGKYQHYKNENLDDYFAAVGIPYIGRKMMSMSSPLLEITIDGDKMTVKTVSMLRTVESSFKLDEEYDEKMPFSSIKSITTILSDNEMTTNSTIPETGDKCGRRYMFTEDECVITLTHDKVKVPAKRYFKRMK